MLKFSDFHRTKFCEGKIENASGKKKNLIFNMESSKQNNFL